MDRKERYISKEEKAELLKDYTKARIGKSILKAGALVVGGVSAMAALASFGLVAPIVIVGGVSMFLGKSAFNGVIDSFYGYYLNKKQEKEK